MKMNRREFIGGIAATAATGCISNKMSEAELPKDEEAFLSLWQREADLVKPEHYRLYMQTGDTQGLAALERLEDFGRATRSSLSWWSVRIVAETPMRSRRTSRRPA